MERTTIDITPFLEQKGWNYRNNSNGLVGWYHDKHKTPDGKYWVVSAEDAFDIEMTVISSGKRVIKNDKHQ